MSRRRTRGAACLLTTILALGCGGDGAAAGARDGTVLSPYLAIGDALAADRVDELGTLGALVIEAAGAREDQPGVDALVRGAGRVGSPDIATARLAFETMSEGMLEYLRANPGDQAGLVVVHCPMTFEGRGADWVQREGKIMNPYEGAKMLHCGDKRPWAP